MRSFTKISFLFVVAVLFNFGCERRQTTTPGLRPAKPIDANSLCAFAPSEIEILPLTAFAGPDGEKLTVYVNLLDAYNTKIKAPVILRFELYERTESMLGSKGKRVLQWPDFDLAESEQNNIYWRDYLRAYEFEFEFTPKPGQKYFLQAICITPLGQRLIAAFNM